MPYLGMQVLIEGLALAAFGMIRDTTTKPLPKQILAYVMQDEARHVAFGRMALRDYYKQLSDAELREREEFVIEGCYLMRDRLRGVEVLENFGIAQGRRPRSSASSRSSCTLFRKLLFSRIVPCVKDIGLWGERLQKAYVDMGVFELGDSNLDLLMAQDEEIAEQLDATGSRRRNRPGWRRSRTRSRTARRRRPAAGSFSGRRQEAGRETAHPPAPPPVPAAPAVRCASPRCPRR